MKVHHLDACTMCPFGGSWLWGQPARMCAHVLLVETPAAGLVLVDAGTSLLDCQQRATRLGPVAVLGGFNIDPSGTAIAQVKKLGYRPDDVRHIVLTHFDLDHAGGICDFPGATVHLLAAEKAAVDHPRGAERGRYRAAHVGALRAPRTYPLDGEAWHGFAAAFAVEGLAGQVLLVPLTGHTRGHAAVAVQQGDRWLVHAGDAYFHRGRMTGERVTPGHAMFERLAASDPARMRANQERLAEIAAHHPELRVFCAHDPHELAALQEAA
jgi:glyoxylase-like metal-dependent hydrolase (beta-lactamase superfamily II)